MRNLIVPGARQRGAATLLVSMVLLVAATLLVLYVSNTIVGEQRMSANEVRSKQAFEAAQAAVELSIRHINDDTVENPFQAASEDTLNGSWSSANSSYRVMFCEPATVPNAQQCADLAANGIAPACTPPAAGVTSAWVVSCGWSDDSAARKRIVTLVAKTDPLPGDITNPLTAKGSVGMIGNSTVVNYFNNLTVWSGQSLDNSGNTGKTVIKRPSSTSNLTAAQVDTQVGNGNQVCNVSQAPDLICTTSSGVFGPDVIQSDSTLANLTQAEFFENFMGMSPSLYKSTMAEEIVAGADAGTISEGGKVYWVEGDATISQNIGTASEPVILVVNGTLTFSGNPVIYGVVVVNGGFNTSGTPKVRGAVVSAGNVASDGTLNIIYDPDVIDRLGQVTGKYATVPGTWRDF